MAECIHRCTRLHPHCTLTIARNAAPDIHWHWIVTMPDGHCFDVSWGGLSFDEALADMNTKGVASLKQADARWRADHLDHPRTASEIKVRT